MKNHHHDHDHHDLQVFTSNGEKTTENEIKANFSRRHFLMKGGIGLGGFSTGFFNES